MDSKKQQLLLEYLMSSPDTFALCQSIIKPDYFNPEFRKTVILLDEYYSKYNSIPDLSIVKAETGRVFELHQITKDQISYCADEIATFCRRKAIEQAVIKASTLIDKDDPGTIEKLVKDAVSVSLHKNTGSDYFLNVQSRLERLSKTPHRTSTGWKDVDNLLGGGLARTELLLVSANSGGGKSITLANLAANMVLSGFNVLYLSLELSIDLVEQRFDTIFTGIPTVNWQSNVNKIVKGVTEIGTTSGELIVEWMPSGTNSNGIRALLKEFELRRGYVPDLLIVDYLDQMSPNERINYSNIWEKDKLSTEQLCDILKDYNMFGATASQQNRSAIDATELNQGHIAGGISKVNTADWYISIILTPAMKAKGEIIFQFLKSRSSDAVGKQTLLTWDNVQLRITDSTSSVDIIEETISSDKGKRSLLDVMDL